MRERWFAIFAFTKSGLFPERIHAFFKFSSQSFFDRNLMMSTIVSMRFLNSITYDMGIFVTYIYTICRVIFLSKTSVWWVEFLDQTASSVQIAWMLDHAKNLWTRLLFRCQTHDCWAESGITGPKWWFYFKSMNVGLWAEFKDYNVAWVMYHEQGFWTIMMVLSCYIPFTIPLSFCRAYGLLGLMNFYVYGKIIYSAYWQMLGSLLGCWNLN